MHEWLVRLRDYAFGALGGLLSGAVASVAFKSIIFRLFDYQEAWYLRYAPFLILPAIVMFLYVAAMAAMAGSNSRWRFVFAILGTVPVFLVYLISGHMISYTSWYVWIEFISLWTLFGQFAAIFLVASWDLFWRSLARFGYTDGDAER
jgi:hypothetical protein